MSADSLPFCSVIIPTYDRPAGLARCLAALAALRYPRTRFEVLVVDDGSPTPPAAAVAAVDDHLDIRLLSQTNAGPGVARNTGAAHARGALLAFTDDDCRPAPEWLTALATRFAAVPDRLLGGCTRNALADNASAHTSQVIVDTAYAYYNPDPDRATFFASNNLAVPAAAFRALGGFDPRFRVSEDRELCDRWCASGRRMSYVPEALVEHAHVLTLRGFWRQHFHYGRGAFRFHAARAARGAGPFRPEWAFYARLLGHPFIRERGRRRLETLLLLSVAQFANGAGFIAESWQPWRGR
jgi:glycosyltransferase involved in cell wall biosynthesis